MGILPRKKSLQRVLKCDGVIVEKSGDITPEDILEIKTYVDANRTLSMPFDIVLNGKTSDLSHTQRQDKLLSLSEAGATWWIEGLWDASEETALEYIRRGPPLAQS